MTGVIKKYEKKKRLKNNLKGILNVSTKQLSNFFNSNVKSRRDQRVVGFAPTTMSLSIQRERYTSLTTLAYNHAKRGWDGSNGEIETYNSKRKTLALNKI